MEASLDRLLPFYAAARARAAPLAFATLLATEGSTYRKAGAHMLFDAEGGHAGLLSGGCLESDLAQHAAQVIADRGVALLAYDMRGKDDALWALGSGCEGALRILLAYCGPANDWSPMPWLAARLAEHRTAVWGIVVPERYGRDARLPQYRLAPAAADGSSVEAIAQVLASGEVRTTREAGGATVLWLPLPRARCLLLCGAGPDAPPVAELARFLGWRVIVADHRAAYAQSGRFAAGVEVHERRATPWREWMAAQPLDAAVVMSHHLETDAAWLTALAQDPPEYVGLLGPAARRRKLLDGLAPAAQAALSGRLRAPVGLDLGGRSPESIALAIIAEIHAVLHARTAEPLGRDTADSRGAARRGAGR
ncbi:MAG: XdhC family protein [Steroidobacteraceae bacterium]|nr:XdhC family protein [Steroidobacteraceae bacterium]MDW8259764.1 XdhC family protein [Gammaproteobacteria bacterium]